MTAKPVTVRNWGSVWDAQQNRPVAAIRDLPDVQSRQSREFRIWAMACWDGDKPPKSAFRKEHVKGCSQEKPCQKCQIQAAYWWFEWEARDWAEVVK